MKEGPRMMTDTEGMADTTGYRFVCDRVELQVEFDHIILGNPLQLTTLVKAEGFGFF